MGDMATIILSHLKRFKDRHGRWRCYYRRPGYPSVTLPDVGETGFLAAYEAAGKPPESDGAGGDTVPAASVHALISAYYQSAAFGKLRASTQRAWRNQLDRFRSGPDGHKPADEVQTHHFDKIFEDMAQTPAQASNLRKRLRAVFKLAVKMRWRKDNPIKETEALPYRTKGFTPWSEEEIARYEAHWASGTRERLALALLLYTGQRRGDVVTMGRQHVFNGRLRVQQQKTGTILSIQIHPYLKREIDAAPGNLNFLLTNYGSPFSPAGFTAWFVKRSEMAGVFERTPHGLRKAAGRRLAEASASVKEVMAVLGHKTISEAQKYIEDADQVRLADQAIARIGGKREPGNV